MYLSVRDATHAPVLVLCKFQKLKQKENYLLSKRLLVGLPITEGELT
jgi:hypothetical protein